MMSDEIKAQAALYAALAKAQGAMSNPVKNREVSVRSDRGAYKFAYATLDAILDGIRAPLAGNGLSFTQTLERTPEGMVMCMRLFHAAGGMLHTCMPIDAKAQKMQELGSLITFARRYQIAAFFGLAAEEDDDANAADGNNVDAVKDKPSKGDDTRAKFKSIRDAIMSAAQATDIAEILIKNKDTLAEIKKVSEAGYQAIMKAKDDRLAELETAE
jgi:hypothetical protein